jgi:hypothetical protein
MRIRIRTRIQPFVSMRIQIRIHGGKPMRIHADPGPGQTLKSQKVEFSHKKILKVGNSKKIPMKFKQKLFDRQDSGLLIFFGQFRCSWIRIRIPNTDPDPGQPHECGSGSISQRHGSVDPEPHQNDMDPQHCYFLTSHAKTK